MKNCLKHLRKNAFLLLTFPGIVLGMLLGVGLRYVDLGYDGLAWLSIWGELFMRMLKIVILPLVATCMISGICSIDKKSSGGFVGMVTFIYIILANLITTTLGVILAVIIQPGARMTKDTEVIVDRQFTSYTDIFLDLLRNLVPDNIVGLAMQSVYTDHDVTWAILTNHTAANLTNHTAEVEVLNVARSIQKRDGLNTVGLVTVSLGLGLAINAAGKDGEPLLNVIRSLYSAVEKLLMAIFWYVPIGIFSLIASAIAQVESLEEVAISLGMFVLGFSICFLIHLLVLIPIVYYAVCRKNPFKYYAKILDAMLAGFAPPSSSAAFPFLLDDMKSKVGIRPELANFVMPLQTTCNKAGSSMFITYTLVFISQAQGVPLTVGAYIITILMTIILSLTLANVPSTAIVMIVIVCNTVQLPVQNIIGVIMVTEFLLDRLRTVNNVVTQGFGCEIIEKFCPKPDEENHYIPDAKANPSEPETAVECLKTALM